MSHWHAYGGDVSGRVDKESVFSMSDSMDVEIGTARVEGPIHLDGRMVGLATGVELSGNLLFTIDFNCTRCLVPGSASLGSSFARILTREEDEDGYSIADDGWIELGGLVRDELGVAIPSVPVCQTGCLGLCAVCGADLNRDPCPGHDDTQSSPFRVLEELLDPER